MLILIKNSTFLDVEWDRIIRRSNPGIISIRTYGGKHYHVEISLIVSINKIIFIGKVKEVL